MSLHLLAVLGELTGGAYQSAELIDILVYRRGYPRVYLTISQGRVDDRLKPPGHCLVGLICGLRHQLPLVLGEVLDLPVAKSLYVVAHREAPEVYLGE